MSRESFLQKLREETTRTFLLPTLQEEITYKKMDVIESSVNGSMPHFLATKVLETMKKSVTGIAPSVEIEEPKDEDVKELLVKATAKWKELVIDPKLSDEEIVEVPAIDRLSWFLNAIYEAQEAGTEGGGVVNATEVANFPNKRRAKGNTQRSVNS